MIDTICRTKLKNEKLLLKNYNNRNINSLQVILLLIPKIKNEESQQNWNYLYFFDRIFTIQIYM